ncbi:hypothetical protein BKP44_15470 [Formosa algae]|nr:hypothetical protein BKP44_15470 [Formosa algae]
MELKTKSKAIFITNYRYTSSETKDGGVKLCTQDFIKVIEKNITLNLLRLSLPLAYLKNQI